MRIFERFFLGFCFLFTFGTVVASSYYCSSQEKVNYAWHPSVETTVKKIDLYKKFNIAEENGKFVIKSLVNKNNLSTIRIPSFVDNNGKKVPLDISKEFIDSLKQVRENVKTLTIGGNVNIDLFKLNDKGNFFNKLETLEIEYGIRKIPNNLFVTPSLKTIKLPDSIEIIDSQAFRNTFIKEIELPNTIKELLSQSFAFASQLEKVTFRTVNNLKPSEVVKIGSAVFQGTNISSFAFPNTLKSVNFEFTIDNEISFIFYECSNLKTIVSTEFVKNNFLEKTSFKSYVESKRITWNTSNL